MKKAMASGLLAIGLAASSMFGSAAAAKTYIKFEKPSVAGTSASSEHASEIEILSFSDGYTQPTSPVRSTAGGGSLEGANHSRFIFTKYVDSATDDLLRSCWLAEKFGKVTVAIFRSDDGPVPVLRIEMEHVVIWNYAIEGGPGGLPIEKLSLEYGIIKYTYKNAKNADGTGGEAQSIKLNLETRKIE